MRASNFLEELVAEWYDFKGFFVKTNIPYGIGARGGIKGEIDILAYNPKDKCICHIEVSSDSDSWDNRIEKFKKRFNHASAFYDKILPFNYEQVKKIAILSFGEPLSKNRELFEQSTKARLITLTAFFREIKSTLENIDPNKQAIPESYLLLRTIQFFIHHTWFKKE